MQSIIQNFKQILKSFGMLDITLLVERRKSRYISSHMLNLLFLSSCSVVSDSKTLDCSMLGFPVLHYLLEFAVLHVK